MRRLLTLLLVLTMIDWIFFSGSYAVAPLMHGVSAGAGFAADLVMKNVG